MYRAENKEIIKQMTSLSLSSSSSLHVTLEVSGTLEDVAETKQLTVVYSPSCDRHYVKVWGCRDDTMMGVLSLGQHQDAIKTALKRVQALIPASLEIQGIVLVRETLHAGKTLVRQYHVDHTLYLAWPELQYVLQSAVRATSS